MFQQPSLQSANKTSGTPFEGIRILSLPAGRSQPARSHALGLAGHEEGWRVTAPDFGACFLLCTSNDQPIALGAEHTVLLVAGARAGWYSCRRTLRITFPLDPAVNSMVLSLQHRNQACSSQISTCESAFVPVTTVGTRS